MVEWAYRARAEDLFKELDMATYPIRPATTGAVWKIAVHVGDALQGNGTIIAPELMKMEIPVIVPRADQTDTPLVAEGHAMHEGRKESVFEEA